MTTVVHIGVAKAASTTLQHGLFPNLERFGVVYYPPSEPSWSRLVSDLVNDRATSALQTAAWTGPSQLLSHEGLSIRNGMGSGTLANSLVGIFGSEIRILMLVREPKRWLISRFLQDEKRNMSYRSTGYFPFDRWLAGDFHEALALHSQNPSVLLYKPLARVDFSAIVESYLEAGVPPSQMCVFPVEALATMQAEFLARLALQSGIDPAQALSRRHDLDSTTNVSPSTVEMGLHRVVDRLVGKPAAKRTAHFRSILRTLPGSSGNVVFENALLHSVVDRFGEAVPVESYLQDIVRRLRIHVSSIEGIDITKFGYTVGSGPSD